MEIQEKTCSAINPGIEEVFRSDISWSGGACLGERRERSTHWGEEFARGPSPAASLEFLLLIAALLEKELTCVLAWILQGDGRCLSPW